MPNETAKYSTETTEPVTRFMMSKDVVTDESSSREFHVNLWFLDDDGIEKHRRKSFPENSGLADIMEEFQNYGDWDE